MVIYIITNLITGKQYIGKDRNNLNSYLGGGIDIKKDVVKYGRNNFEKVILEECFSIEELKRREIFYLEKFDVKNNPNFYNKTNKSHGCSGGSRNFHHTKEFKDKMRILQQGNTYRLGNKLSLKTKNKIGKSNSKPKPLGFGEKLSTLKKGKPSPLKGKPHTSNNKAVICFDYNGDMFREFKSQIEAESKMGLCKGSISKGIKTGYRMGGYKWKYKN